MSDDLSKIAHGGLLQAVAELVAFIGREARKSEILGHDIGCVHANGRSFDSIL